MIPEITPIQQLYYAWDLSHKKSTSDDDRFTGILSEAKVDLNPHQIEAALFAFKSPLSKGAILADEVGLGKTIEAGIILAEMWAEHKRHVIVVVPASLRSQWNEELFDKFHLKSKILQRESYEISVRSNINPFIDEENIIICSYEFARKHSEELINVAWDLVVLDEAHKLRNCYKSENVMANSIKKTFMNYKKILLTATPLQNNLKELYGLISIIDPEYFSTVDTFNKQYNAITTRDASRYGELKDRLGNIVHRTLRKQVKEYVNFTRRTPFVQEYQPSKMESELYNAVRKYLFEDCVIGINPAVWPMLSLLIQKILSSSAYAISFTLEKLAQRLRIYQTTGKLSSINGLLSKEMELDDDPSELISENNESLNINDIQTELASLEHCIKLAKSIKTETKAVHLLKALTTVFEKNLKLGANRKALIFTESVRTQEYLKKFLEMNGFEKKVVCFNGSNNDEESMFIYRRWLSMNKGSEKISHNRDLDMKQALVDYFRNDADIMIATESGAEGINLQFCSIVVNYDLPWNPQRVEQRIGRCHRYGQKHDVVVVNFVNTENYADERVYELLDQKFQLFEGVFGCSDEVLGSFDSGMELEKRINSIYRRCRTRREIESAFDDLQRELDDVIHNRIEQTKISLLENFDEEVVEKLKIRQSKDEERINSYNRHFWLLTKSVLQNKIIDINDRNLTFNLTQKISSTIPTGTYILNKECGNYNQLRITHPLGEYIIKKALDTSIVDSCITFKVQPGNGRHVYMENFVGMEGYVIIHRIVVSNLYDNQENLLFSSSTADGEILPADFGEKILELRPIHIEQESIPTSEITVLEQDYKMQLDTLTTRINTEVDHYVNYEIDKYEAWSDDHVYSIKEEVKNLRRTQDELKRQIRRENNASLRLDLEEEKRKVTKLLRNKEVKMYEIMDQEDEKIESMTSRLREAMHNKFSTYEFGKFKWRII